MGGRIPTIGRIVHIVWHDGAHRPAIVVEVVDGKTGRIAVQRFFGDGTSGCKYQEGVEHDETASTPNTWHWPEVE